MGEPATINSYICTPCGRRFKSFEALKDHECDGEEDA